MTNKKPASKISIPWQRHGRFSSGLHLSSKVLHCEKKVVGVEERIRRGELEKKKNADKYSAAGAGQQHISPGSLLPFTRPRLKTALSALGSFLDVGWEHHGM